MEKFVDKKDEPENLQYRWIWMMNWLKKHHPKIYDEISKAYMEHLNK